MKSESLILMNREMCEGEKTICLAVNVFEYSCVNDRTIIPFTAHAASNPIVITFWDTGTITDVQTVINMFNKKYAGQYKVEFQAPTYNNETEAVNAAVAAHKEPDIMEESFTPSVAYALEGLEVPLNSLFKMAGINPAQDFPSSLWNQATVNGIHYAAPTDTLSTLLFYNKRLFRVAGLNPSKPPESTAICFICGKIN
ncbi:hypothetical protein GCM10025858_30020 [Alicyclobacillus sacchari]|uniref:extracellular solute-binding protein n=1 Tax=Alicyclobacillus sacchari TaxID=392010 RepID=UPI0023E9D68B|nr:extracellular solute-binding protein [Alicyclobacillus sacchari]GMA58499.1 hypothetical protein GCM10025858_30020 [Alicyclobacillus sacchari]